jgi:hypothetical protein
MANFIYDTLTDTADTDLHAHVGETGASWTYIGNYSGGNSVITAADRARSTNSQYDTEVYASGTPATAEYDVSVDFYCASLAGHLYIVAWAANASNWISDYPEQPFWRLQRDGVWTVHAPPGLARKTGDDIPQVSALRSNDVRAEFSPDVQAAQRSSGYCLSIRHNSASTARASVRKLIQTSAFGRGFLLALIPAGRRSTRLVLCPGWPPAAA